MNADRLLANFNTLVDTPGAVPRLRRFILDLAVRGKLVPQDPTDEPASELLSRIAAEKSRLTASRTAKKQRTVKSTSGATDRTFVLPSGWSSTRLDAVTLCLDHMREPINAAERTRRIAGKAQSELFPYFGATQQQGWIDDFLFDEELVLLGEDGVPFLDPLRPKAYVISGKSWVNNHAHVFRGIFVSNSYLAHWLNAFDYSGRIVGATRAKLNQSRALDIPIMLPPFAEQHRIVAKIDDLMTLCDRLEEARQEREAARDRFATTSLARLGNPDPDLSTFHADAAFAIENFDRITARADQVAALRRTVLDLAVRGRLVPQDPTDEPAQELLKRVAEERDRLKKIGKMRKTPAGKLAMVRAPFSLPDTWRWAALGDVFAYDVGIKRESNAMDPSLWLLELQDVERNTGSLLVRVTAAERETKSTKSEFRTGDILYGKLRPYLNKVLVAEERGYSTTEIVALRPYIPLCGRYCSLALRQRDFVDYVTHVGQGTKMPRLRTKDAIVAPFPLPPLAEQHRIVAKADELMTWCDRLEERLVTTEDARRGLLDAVLNEAVESNTCGHAMAATASVAVA